MNQFEVTSRQFNRSFRRGGRYTLWRVNRIVTRNGWRTTIGNDTVEVFDRRNKPIATLRRCVSQPDERKVL